MKKSDFTKGQDVCLLVVEGSNAYRRRTYNLLDDRLLPATVISIDSKYITVEIDHEGGRQVQFDISNRFLQHYEAGSNDFELFLTKQDALNTIKATKLYREVANGFSRWYNDGKYSLDQLERIKAIMEEQGDVRN